MQMLLIFMIIDLFYLIKYEKGKEKYILLIIIFMYICIYYIKEFEYITKSMKYLLEITIPLYIFFQIYDIKQNKIEPNYIVVLGCGLLDKKRISPLLMQRCNIAICLYHKNPVKIIVSGGQGKDEIISEASAMKNYLIEHHIPKQDILCEEQSKNTKENLIYTSKLIGNEYTVITSDYHRLRVNILAKINKLNIQVIPSNTIFYYHLYACIREYFAILSLFSIYLFIYFLLFFLL